MRKPVLLFLLLASGLLTAETAENNYRLECQGCHGFDGGGAVETVPPLKNQMARFLSVEGGREFLVRVPGSAQSPLSDQALADTLNWMLREFGPQAIARRYPPYTAEEVAGLRKTALKDVALSRAILFEKLNDADN